MEGNIYYHDYRDGSWFRICMKYFPPAEKEVAFVEMKAQKMKPFTAALYDMGSNKDLLKEMYNSIGEFLKLNEISNVKEKFEKGFPKKCVICGKDYVAKSPNSKFCSDECKSKAKEEVKETDQNG